RHPRGPQYWAPWWQDPGAPAGSPRWDNWGRRPGGRPGQGDPAEGPPLPATAPLPPRHRRDSSALLGLLAVVFGLAWLAAGSHLVRVSGEAVLAIALMVLGAATVITARTDWALSRRKWPIWLGAGLVIVLIGTWTSPGFGRDFHSVRVGAQPVAFTTWDSLGQPIDAGFGRRVVDLTGLPLPPPPDTTVRINADMGIVTVELPDQLHVHLTAHADFGAISVNGRRLASGVSPDANTDLNATAPGPTVEMDVNSGAGLVRIVTLQQPVPPTALNPPATPTTPTTPALTA
ncbi:MAG TPA: hypothetical protein VKQ71_04780, partial [Acidimicrobiales bacterium]|nr:hypothetical protein [Acidimicrobiales bacterium]